MHRLRFPKYYRELSNEQVLVSEFIRGDSLEDGIDAVHFPGLPAGLFGFMVPIYSV